MENVGSEHFSVNKILLTSASSSCVSCLCVCL